ncbi:UNVERIFIED_CONTAM: hypothetical protein GTU68_008554 [Idotea baltica]|nr:hypothetical protein [Idotea baltica]
MDKGQLVPDEVTIGMLRNKVEMHPTANGFIFDGFPRTDDQAIALDELMNEKGTEVHILLSLEVEENEIVQRLLKHAQPGQSGQEHWKILELKVLADVGLVGFPNAGKSTLLSVVSAAKPKIANYAFTTLVPNLGIVSYRDGRSFIMADIPGIIEHAHTGKGLGIRFLRHIERNAALLFMVPADTEDIKKEYKILLNELEKYNPELLDKPRLLAISKSDLIDDELKEWLIPELPKGLPYIFFSSATQQGINQLKDKTWELINA